MAVKDISHFQLRKLTLFAITKRVSLLVCAIAIAVSANSLLISTLVNAKTVATMTPTEEVTSLTYYATLGRCVQNNMYGDINLKVGDNGSTTPSRGGDSNNGAWFDDRDAWAKTFTSNNQACDDIAKNALALWGWGTDYQQFLRDIGYQYQPNNNPPRWHGPGDAGNGDTRRARFEQAVQAKAYTQNFSGKPTISNQAWYELAQKNFYGEPCSAKDLGKIDSLNADVKSRVTSNAQEGSTVYSSFYIVNRETKAIENHGFSYQKPDLDLVTLYGYRGSGQDSNNGAQMGCGELGKKMSDTAPSYAAYLRKNPTFIPPDATTTGVDCNTDNTCTPNGSNCRVDGVGWIICPVINFLAEIVDKSYSVVAALLTTPPLNTKIDDAANGAYVAWSMMRNFANIAFVIVFLIIIYAQISGMGINNYGIKKILPKLIVAAILVNVSYWLCAIAVDVSNIAGISFKGLFDGITAKMPLPESSVSNTGGEVWGPLAAAALAAGTVAILGLTVLLPLLIGALAAIVTVLLVLVLRQALIITLIVISPLAFVALLLPNTEGLFKKWRALLTTLLVMFPIIAIIFGASALASRIIQSTTYSGQADAEFSGNMILQIVGAGVAIIPLFITPIVMKTAGGVLNRFGGIINNPNKGVFDRMRKGATGLRTSRQALRDAKSYNRTGIRKALDVRGYGVRHRGRSEATLKARQREVQIGAATDVASTVQSGTGPLAWNLRRNLAGGGGEAGQDRALNNATNTLDQLQIAEVKAASAVLSNLNLTRAQKQTLEQGGSINVGGREYRGGNIQKASLENAVNEQRFGDIEDAMKSPANATNDGARSFLANAIKANYATTKAGAAHLVDPGMLQQFVSGKDATGNQRAFTETDLVESTEKAMEAMSANLMATQKGPTLNRIENVKIANPTSVAAINAKQTAIDLHINTELFDKMGPSEKATVTRIEV